MSELAGTADRVWLKTREMAAVLGMHPITLAKLKLGGYFRMNHHWRQVNPTAQRSHLRWHRERTLKRMNAS